MQLLSYFQADWIYIIQNWKECVFWKCLLVALCFSVSFTLYMDFKKICIKMWKCAKSLISFTWDFNMNVQALSGNVQHIFAKMHTINTVRHVMICNVYFSHIYIHSILKKVKALVFILINLFNLFNF